MNLADFPVAKYILLLYFTYGKLGISFVNYVRKVIAYFFPEVHSERVEIKGHEIVL